MMEGLTMPLVTVGALLGKRKLLVIPRPVGVAGGVGFRTSSALGWMTRAAWGLLLKLLIVTTVLVLLTANSALVSRLRVPMVRTRSLMMRLPLAMTVVSGMVALMLSVPPVARTVPAPGLTWMVLVP